jgi:hypothetical protein
MLSVLLQYKISGPNIKKIFPVPTSSTHKSFDGAKNSKTNISCMGPFKRPIKSLTVSLVFYFTGKAAKKKKQHYKAGLQ